MTNVLTLLTAIAVGGFAYFVYNYVADRKAHRHLTAIERANAEIEEQQRVRAKVGLRERLTTELAKQGYQGDMTPVAAVATVGYLTIALVLRVANIAPLVAVIVAVPLSLAGAYLAFTTMSGRRRRRFNMQLEQMFNLVAAQIESGMGPQRALAQVVPNLANPLKAEMSAALDATVASKDLVSAIRDLYPRYPSRALDLFIATLEIDRDQGGKVEPALRQAALILRREFELTQEAEAEMSQTKMEAAGVIAIIATVAAKMLLGGDASTRHAYGSPVAILVLSAAGAWFALGVWRTLRLFRKARGEL